MDKWDWCIVLGFVLIVLAIAGSLETQRLEKVSFQRLGPDYSVLADVTFLVGAVFMAYGVVAAPYESQTKPKPFTLKRWFSSWVRNPLGRPRSPPRVYSETQCVSRIASKAGLSEKTKSRALVILKRAEEGGISAGKDTMGLAAAALYVACILEGEDKTQKDLAEAAGVTEVTIRNRFKGLRDSEGI